MPYLAPLLAVLALCAAPAALAAGSLTVSGAWTPTAALGTNTPLFMTITNDGAADQLLRARCDAASFTEPHALDQGEGFPSMRTVKSIPVAANGVTRLDPNGYHVMLLQTTRALAVGDTFTCSVTFRDAGKQDVEVTVGQPE